MRTSLQGLSMLSAVLLAGVAFAADENPSAQIGANLPEARFRGPLTYDFGVTNVKWEAATPEYSYVTFDLHWSYSWRAKWTEPAKTSATGKDMEIENWDAAWVFVKFLPEKDSEEAQERNHWLHATLDKSSASHVMPAGATNSVKLSDDGTRGMGLFIYRDAIGHGANDWKGIKLRWNHGADKVEPAKADVKVHAIAMVYVPEGPFKVGTGNPSGIYQKFADGPDMPAVHNMQNIRAKNQEMGGLTDGSWRGGNSIPCLIDAEWNAPAKEGTRARRIGNAPGELWGTHTFWEVNLGCIAVGLGGALPDEYPTGYEGFYCMKYELTQGQYVDFLNSLPPDVAAERAFVGSEVHSDAGIHSATVNLPMGPGRDPYQVTEVGGCTIFSSADFSENVEAPGTDTRTEEEKKKEAAVDALMGDLLDNGKGGRKKGAAAARRPVYTARLPFRRLCGATTMDTFAFAVWAGMRPMSQLEGGKAGNGARDPLAPPDWTAPTNLDAPMVIADEGLPTERFAQGNSVFGHSVGLRVGCFSTPTSDRGTALATYWGITELGGPEIPLREPGFRGTHGNGMTSPGKPGAPFKRTVGESSDAPADWAPWWSYLRGHFVENRCRMVISAGNRIRRPSGEPVAAAAKHKPALPIPPVDGRKDDMPRVANVKIEPGKEFSTVSFDLSWNNSWRAKWTEPAEKNCTGKPLTLESWDAAWVFLKFRPQGTKTFSHATLSPDAAHHAKPAGAVLEMGLSDEAAGGGAGGAKGIGVFIYRDAVGQGASDFKGIKLRWQNGVDQADPATAELSVHAIAMVYVPEGPFRSKNPVMYYVDDGGSWSPDAYVCQLMTIDTPDASKPSGHSNHASTYGKAKKPYPHEGPDWPNGYNAFYCMKYSISQGEYARFLGETGGIGGYDRGSYGRSGDTILYSVGEGRYEAEVPERPVKNLSDANIYSFTAWAGLRPPSCLEYEKACRGPRAVASDEDAWASGVCAPASGLAQFVPSLARQEAPANRRLVWPGPSYWGIRDLSQSGAIIEWPAIVIEDGRGYSGNHGAGTAGWPQNWPYYSRGEWYAYGMLQGFPLSQIGLWFMPEEGSSLNTVRAGRYGARAVRTAASRNSKDSPLQVEALPNLAGCDMAIVNLSGQYKNDGSQPVKVELVLRLPEASFPQGATSRTFTAAAKAVTPFKVPVVLTRAITNVTVRGGGALLLPLQLKSAGGDVVAESSLRLPVDVLDRPVPIIQSLDGGKLELKVKNATQGPQALTFELLPPPVVKLGQTRQSVTVAAGGDGVVVFPVPKEWFPREGPCGIPYRVTIGAGTPMSCETVAELQMRTRWWVKKTAKTKPKVAGSGDAFMPSASDEVSGFEGVFSEAGDVYTLAAPAKGWKAVVGGTAVALGEAGPLPSRESKATGATRVVSVGDVDAVLDAHAVNANGGDISMDPPKEGAAAFFVRVWFNENLVFDSHVPSKERKPKSVRIRKGANTLVAEWESNVDGGSAAQGVQVEFTDPKTGKPVPDLVLDMERK